MKISAFQIDQASLALVIQQNTSGAAFSGNFVSYVQGSGFMGPTVVWTTGGAQDVSGVKRFVDSPIVPYSGGTGRAPSAGWVNDQLAYYSGWANGTFPSNTTLASASGQLSVNLALTGSGLYALLVNQSGQASTDYATKSALTNSGASLSRVYVSGGSLMPSADFSGVGGTIVYSSGGRILISGGAGGGGGSSTVKVTGSSAIASPNFTGAGTVIVSYDGTFIYASGSAYNDAGLSGYIDNNFVNRTTAQSITGIKTFVSSPVVPTATLGTQAINLAQLSGASGVLAAIGGGTTNNYTFSGITGNFVNMSFWFDQYNLATGLNTIEAVVGRSFFFTGYSVGTIETGTQGFFSGSFYQRTPTNAKTRFIDFSLNSGVFFRASGGYNQTVTGLNRIGLDIYTIGTGITGLSVGLFGVGY